MAESGSILIYKTTSMNTANGATQTFRYEIDNLGSVSISLEQPVSPMALPQEDASENVLVKMEGNTQTCTINWKVANSTATPLTSLNKLETGGILTDIAEFYYYNSTGNNTYYNSANTTTPTATWSPHSFTDSGETVSWLLNQFQGRDLTDRYMVKIPNIGVMEGFITRLNAAIDGGSPVVYSLSLTFIMGNVISIYETDAPSEPRNASISTVNSSGGSSGTKTRMALSWSAPSDSATTISHYGIWVRDELSPYSGSPDLTVSVYDGTGATARSNELAGHVTGGNNYEVSFDDPNYANTHFVDSEGNAFISGQWNKIKGTALVSGKSYMFKIAASNVAGGYGLKTDEFEIVMP
jgi:hypothetical protein